MVQNFLIKTLPVIAVTAEAGAGAMTDNWGPLINLGAIGCVLAWFLLKTEPRLRRIEEAIDRNSRVQLVAVIAMHGVPQHIKDQAKQMMAEVDKATDRRANGGTAG